MPIRCMAVRRLLRLLWCWLAVLPGWSLGRVKWLLLLRLLLRLQLIWLRLLLFGMMLWRLLGRWLILLIRVLVGLHRWLMGGWSVRRYVSRGLGCR